MTKERALFIGALVIATLGGGLWLLRPDRAPAATTASGATTAAALDALTHGDDVKIEFTDKPVAVPAFAAIDLAGKAIDQTTGKGKVVLLNFWATWCGPCRDEIPTLVALQEHYGQQLVVIGLSIDDPSPTIAEDVKAFVQKYKINYTVALADEKTQRAFGGFSSVPSTFVVGTDGKIVQRHRGMLQPAQIEHEIRALAGLPTPAHVETVTDRGQILSENAPPVDDVPELKLASLSPKQREEALRRLNSERCTCGCNLLVGRCRVDDPTCSTSPDIAKKILEDVKRSVR